MISSIDLRLVFTSANVASLGRDRVHSFRMTGTLLGITQRCDWLKDIELSIVKIVSKVIIVWFGSRTSLKIQDFVTIQLVQNLIKTGLKPLKSDNVPTAVFLFVLTSATDSSTHWKGVTQNASNCIIPSSVKTITGFAGFITKLGSCFKHYYFLKLNSPLRIHDTVSHAVIPMWL